jgi:hypothetical protein
LRGDLSIANTAIIFYEDIDQASAYARQEAPMTQQDVSQSPNVKTAASQLCTQQLTPRAVQR